MMDLPSQNLSPGMTSSNADLRSLPWFPFGVGEFRQFKPWLACKKNPSAGFYMINLLRAAWHDIPAGSIEDDDDILADAAMCDPEEWPSHKAAALNGWILCADGRWYSAYLAPKVLAALDQKSAQSARTRNATEARKNKLQGPLGTETPGGETNVTSSSRDRDEHVTLSFTSPKENRREENKKSPSSGESGVARSAPASTRTIRSHRIPQDWQPSHDDRQFCTELGLDPETIAAAFNDYWRAAGGNNARKVDWSAAWRFWCRREAEGRRGHVPRPTMSASAASREGAIDANQQRIRELEQRYPPNAPSSDFFEGKTIEGEIQ